MTQPTSDQAPFPMKRVRFVSILEAEAGMVLALPVSRVHEHRPFHLPAGVVLAPEVIAQIRSHQVNCIAVETRDARSVGEIGEALFRESARIDAVFAPLDPDDPVAARLRAAVMEYRLCFN